MAHRGRLRIVLVANLHHPTSGGLRTAVDRLAPGCAAQGHADAAPGQRTVEDAAGLRPGAVTVLTVAAPRVPGAGGYRLMDPRRQSRLVGRVSIAAMPASLCRAPVAERSSGAVAPHATARGSLGSPPPPEESDHHAPVPAGHDR